MCYEEGLTRNQDLGGTVSVTFAVGVDGAVHEVKAQPTTTLSDPVAVRCILRQIEEARIFKPTQSTSRVVASIEFLPPGSEIENVSDRVP